jgi:phosphoglycerate dehydrogenase-like enzyme
VEGAVSATAQRSRTSIPARTSAKALLVLCGPLHAFREIDGAQCLTDEELCRDPALCDDVVGIIVRSGVTIDRTYVARFPQLAFVIRVGNGVDNIDVDELERRGILLRRNPELSAVAVAELAWLGLTALARRVPLSFAATTRNDWCKATTIGDAVGDLDVAIWGGGPVGQAVFAAAPNRERCTFAAWPSLSDVLPSRRVSLQYSKADAHIICLPARRQTERLVGREFLARVAPKQPYLVNVGRASIVDLPAAVASLDEGRLRGVHLDPIDEEHLSSVTPYLLERRPRNLLVTQHLGAQRADVRKSLDAWAVDEARMLLETLA